MVYHNILLNGSVVGSIVGSVHTAQIQDDVIWDLISDKDSLVGESSFKRFGRPLKGVMEMDWRAEFLSSKIGLSYFGLDTSEEVDELVKKFAAGMVKPTPEQIAWFNTIMDQTSVEDVIEMLDFSRAGLDNKTQRLFTRDWRWHDRILRILERGYRPLIMVGAGHVFRTPFYEDDINLLSFLKEQGYDLEEKVIT